MINQQLGARLCHSCEVRRISPRRRKFCDRCGMLASLVWKREKRREWRGLGQKYWLDAWKHVSDEERKAYFRTYMREYRQNKRRQLQVSHQKIANRPFN